MSERQNSEQATEEGPVSITFYNIKSNHFRVIHVDGASGSLTPQGHLQMAVYSERQANPQEQTFAIRPDGSLGQEIRERRVGKAGLVRELEAELILDLRTAESIRVWLDEWLTRATQLLEEQSMVSEGGNGS